MKYKKVLHGWLRPDAAARELGWSISKVLQACRDGLITGAQKSGSGWYLPEREIAKMAAEIEEDIYPPREQREAIYRHLQEMYESYGLRGDARIPESMKGKEDA